MPRSHRRKPVVTPVVPERIDERSVVAQQCRAWALEVARDLGGFESLSAVEVEILDEAARLRARLLAAWAIDLKDEQPLGLEARERLRAIRGLRADFWRACRMLGLKRAHASENAFNQRLRTWATDLRGNREREDDSMLQPAAALSHFEVVVQDRPSADGWEDPPTNLKDDAR